jgi:peptidoglycan/LPS O-acetylase OafA/YrhL
MQDPATAFNDFKQTKFFGSLDGLRALCILGVLWHHSPAFTELQPQMQLLMRGFIGVDLFFVLSGFLITTLLLREEERYGRFSLRGFYWRRVLRIVPVYFLVVTGAASYFILFKGQWELAPLVPFYYLFLSNIVIGDIPLLAPTWSLSVEEQYYMFWPALLLFLPMNMRLRAGLALGLAVICGLSASGQLAFLGIRPIETAHAVWAFSTNSFPAMFLGSLVAILLNTRSGFVLFYRVLGHAMSPILTLAILLLYLQFGPSRLVGWPNFVMHVIMVLFLASLVIREQHVLRGALQLRPVARLGEISYGLYLYHLFGLHIAHEIGTAFGLGLGSVSALFVIFSIIISEISFRTYERYFLSLKGKPWGSGKATAE